MDGNYSITQADLLRELGWLHLGPDNLECNQLSRRSVLVEALGLEADGEASLTQLVGGSIADAMRFRHNRRRRVCVDRHASRAR